MTIYLVNEFIPSNLARFKQPTALDSVNVLERVVAAEHTVKQKDYRERSIATPASESMHLFCIGFALN